MILVQNWFKWVKDTSSMKGLKASLQKTVNKREWTALLSSKHTDACWFFRHIQSLNFNQILKSLLSPKKMDDDPDSQLCVYFVTNANPGSRNAPVYPTSMQSAYLSICYRKITAKRISAEKIEREAAELVSETAMFVMDNFNGPAYVCLDNLKARIISPYTIKYCDPECSQPFQTIPMRNFPVFSQCMRGLPITCTGLTSAAKKEIEQKVTLMCGSYETSLNGSTKFLVANSVMTKKYRAAVELKIPVMKVEWVNECWNKHQYDFFLAGSQEIVDKYILPIFFGLTITISQVSSLHTNAANICTYLNV